MARLQGSEVVTSIQGYGHPDVSVLMGAMRERTNTGSLQDKLSNYVVSNPATIIGTGQYSFGDDQQEGIFDAVGRCDLQVLSYAMVGTTALLERVYGMSDQVFAGWRQPLPGPRNISAKQVLYSGMAEYLRRVKRSVGLPIAVNDALDPFFGVIINQDNNVRGDEDSIPLTGIIRSVRYGGGWWADVMVRAYGFNPNEPSGPAVKDVRINTIARRLNHKHPTHLSLPRDSFRTVSIGLDEMHPNRLEVTDSSLERDALTADMLLEQARKKRLIAPTRFAWYGYEFDD